MQAIPATLEKTMTQDQLFVWQSFPVVFCYTLAFNYFLRRDLVGSLLGYGNWLFLFWTVFFVFSYGKALNMRLLWLLPFPFLLWHSEHELMKTLMEVITMILPLSLCCLNIEMTQEEAKKIVKHFLKWFNYLVYGVFALMLIDLVSHNVILRFLGSLSDDYLEYLLKAEEEVLRQGSVFGHQLGTKTIFLVFFSLNELYGKITDSFSWQRWLHLAITLIAVTLTGSKSGFVILVILMLYFFLDFRNPLNFLGVLALLGSAYVSGLLDALVTRFQTTELTTGRFSGWTYVQDSLQQPRFFFGEGQGLFARLELTNKEQDVQAAFEFPILGYLYQFGILFSILLIFLLFGRLLWLFLQKEARIFLIPYLVMVIDVNGYNQLLFNPDFVGVVMMINLVYVLLLVIKRAPSS